MNKLDRLAADGVIGDPILFYGARNPNGWASNFSTHGFYAPSPFDFQTMLWYPTGEHRYQAMKAQTEDHHDFVRRANGPGEAKNRGRDVLLREGWGSSYGSLCWYVMVETVVAKAQQNPVVMACLRETEDRFLYEDSPTDDIWGWRYANNYRGKNLLGHAWMEAREMLT